MQRLQKTMKEKMERTIDLEFEVQLISFLNGVLFCYLCLLIFVCSCLLSCPIYWAWSVPVLNSNDLNVALS